MRKWGPEPIPYSAPLPSVVFLSAALFALGCSGGGGSVTPPGPSPATPPTPAVVGGGDRSGPTIRITHTVIADSIQGDDSVESMVAPFRDRMGEEVEQVIGEAAVPLTKGVPEGTLGNFASDAMLWAASHEMGVPVHMAFTNNGGLRVPIAQGPITVGQMFELMPFENMLSVLTLSGAQVVEVANGLARWRGEPIAGFSFRIVTEGEERVARDVLIAGDPVELEAEYLLVTNDYLANGGEAPSPIHRPLARQDLPVLLRDALIGYVREIGVIHPQLEGRIRGGTGG
jgi:2',3'-cyclic-nucleotide 2'-phosphodiesterase (5'-nucleotidase family)